MRVLVLLVVFTLSQLIAICQDTLYGKLLKDAINTIGNNPTIYYLDSSINFNGKFSRFARKYIVEGFVDLKTDKKVSMLFTRTELREIDRAILDQSPKLWPNDFIEKSARLGYDSIGKFIKVKTTDNLSKSNDRYFYLFSQPVFIRNNSVAIFRLAKMVRPVEGNDFIFIYSREDEKWSHKLTIYAGAW